MTTFQQRALTATVFTAIMLLGMFLHEGTFILLFFIISMGCLWEYMKLTTDDNRLREIGALIIANSLWFVFIFKDNTSDRSIGSGDLNSAIGWGQNVSFYSILIFGFYSFILIPFLLLIIELFQKTDKPFQNVAGTLLGIFYAIVPIFLLISISKENVYIEGTLIQKFTPNIAAGILFLTWINDTGAYLVGSKMGKTPLFPRISPKKTWEGTVGGIIFCILSAFLIHRLLGVLSLTDWMIIGGLVSVFGTLGDLIESMLKRSVGVKDSGTFMPGHGGFLDRFDAFIFEIPFIFLYLMMR